MAYPQGNTGRSYYQRWKYEGWYDRHEGDPQGKPTDDAWLAPTHIIANLRRRQETHYWKGKSKGGVSHRETEAVKGKTKGKRDSSPKGKEKGKPWGYSKGKAPLQKGGKEGKGKGW